MDELKFFLGLQIKQTSEGTFITQAKYTNELIKRFVMMESKPPATSMITSINLDKDKNDKNVYETFYQGRIGSLIKRQVGRISCLEYATRFQSCHKESHLVVVKCIFRYLINTHDLGLFYRRGVAFDLNRFFNADYEGCKVDRKSTSDICQFLGHTLMSWFSKK